MELPDFLARDKFGYVLIAGHRVGLDHVVCDYREGDSVEMLHARYPTVPLAKLHKVIAWYLDHQPEVDVLVDGFRAEAERICREAGPMKPDMETLRKRFAAIQLAKGA